MAGRVVPALSTPAIGAQASIARPPTLATATTTTETTGIAATIRMRMIGEAIATMSSGGSAGNRGAMTTEVPQGSTAETKGGEASSLTATAGKGNASIPTLARLLAQGHDHGRGRDLDTGRGPDLGQGHDRVQGRLDARGGEHGIEARATPPMRAAAACAQGRPRAPDRTRRSTMSRALPVIHLGTLRPASAQ